ncbi:uncharacterized protein M6B38_293525 [Iris pallida]|uniref:Uncharacterized protein n=1 Tax=Iris pallida TaxID=29817 RepID=A0AAX6HWJ4_IRIPA|nr:uncharacterized protein M6B38_293525 [Iris pallida]
MPTITSAALESFLIETRGRSISPKKPASPAVGPAPEEEERRSGWMEEEVEAEEEEEEEEEEEVVEEEDDYFDPRESMSVASSCFSDSEDRFGSLRGVGSGGRGSVSGHSDYYDAPEDLLSDGSFPNLSPSFSTSSKRELQTLRCILFEEVERRKKIEMDLLHIHKQWERVAECLFQLGLSYPETNDSGNLKLMPDPAELCQEITVTRFVSEAVERGLARAEAESVAEEMLDSKDHEISRLRDRLHYHEAVNHEMSQRNQEAAELARQRRTKRRTRQRLIWGCLGLSITIGASLLAYSYFPHSSKDALQTSSPDASSLSSATSVETEGCCPDD